MTDSHPSTGNRPASIWRCLYPWMRLLVAVAVVLWAVDALVVMGVMRPVVVQGSSMAPTLVGPHVRVTCPECQWSFAVAADQAPRDHRYWCPDCGARFVDRQASPAQPGQRVWVNRWAQPGRWDVVVFRCPEQPGEYCIKRVLGLSGEHIDFEQGDLLVDGQVQRKSLAEQRRVRQLVHRERPQHSRWTTAGDQWRRDQGSWTHTGAASELQFDATQITDELGYNQTATQQVHAVGDLMLVFDAELAAGGSLRCMVRDDDGSVFESPIINESGRIEWSLFDRQTLLAIDDRVRHCTPTPRRSRPQQLVIEATSDVVVRDLCIYRDAYYHTRPVDRWPSEGVPLAAAELFVVGDNVAVSQDSRTWQARGLPRDWVIGSPIGVK